MNEREALAEAARAYHTLATVLMELRRAETEGPNGQAAARSALHRLPTLIDRFYTLFPPLARTALEDDLVAMSADYLDLVRRYAGVRKELNNKASSFKSL